MAYNRTEEVSRPAFEGAAGEDAAVLVWGLLLGFDFDSF